MRRLVTILASTLFLFGCASPIVSQQSPNGEWTAVVSETRLVLDYRVTVSVKKGTEETIVLRDPGERLPVLVEVVWRKDSQTFIVLVMNPGPSLIFAYDVTQHRKIDESVMMPELREALIDRYRLESRRKADPNLDVIKWIAHQIDEGNIPKRPWTKH